MCESLKIMLGLSIQPKVDARIISPSTTEHESWEPTKAVWAVGRSAELQSGLSPDWALTLTFAQAERGLPGSISLLTSDPPQPKSN